MKFLLKATAFVLSISVSCFVYATDNLNTQNGDTSVNPYGPNITNSPNATDGNPTNGEQTASGPGAPLPINDYEYALMAAGIAVAGYAALRARKQNA